MSSQTFAANDMSTSLTHYLRHCFRHASRALVVVILLSILVNATPHFISDEDLQDDISMEMPDKRIARLSYYRSPSGSSHRRRYDSYGYYPVNGKYGKKAVSRHKMPWENLPVNNCLRKKCETDDDCCRRYSKCNVQAHVCLDCWYGHPCQTNRDCCEKFPYCNPMLRTCSK